MSRQYSQHGDLRGIRTVTGTSTTEGRFGRLFRHMPPGRFLDADLEALAHAMAGEGADDDNSMFRGDDEENPDIPAGYTYFGQFIDHDLTFDPATSFDRLDDPDARLNFRTPRFDLDSLYGRGPDDQPYLYRDAARFRLGKPLRSVDTTSRECVQGFDLPRTSETDSRLGRALVGDPRNDENRIVSQVHSLFLQFHNRRASDIGCGASTIADLFQRTRRDVTWHYQYLVLKDFLPRLVGEELVDSILLPEQVFLGEGRKGMCWRGDFKVFSPNEQAYMPVEFAGAAYRLGHSMLRPSYHFNRVIAARTDSYADRCTKGNKRTPLFSVANRFDGDLGGFRPMPDDWAFDWRFFFGDRTDETGGEVPRLPQPSYRIDSIVSEPLSILNKVGVVPPDDPVPNLALRNLKRGRELKLPAAQPICALLGIEPMDRSTLFDEVEGRPGRGLDLDAAAKDRLAAETPLWYYVLREAEVFGDGRRLGPIGARIVAEVFIGLLLADKWSYLNVAPAWTPAPEFGGAAFSLRALADYVGFLEPLP